MIHHKNEESIIFKSETGRRDASLELKILDEEICFTIEDTYSMIAITLSKADAAELVRFIQEKYA